MKCSKNARAVLASVLTGFTLSGGALACTTDGWDVTFDAGTNLAVGSPTPEGIWRFEELCGLRMTGEGYVADNSPSHTRVRARFEFNRAELTGAGDANIYEAYNADTGVARGAPVELFHIGFDGANISFDTTGAGGGAMTSTAAAAGWNTVEFDWNSEADTFTFWVNADATTDPATGMIDAGTGVQTLESARLGLPNGLGGLGGAAYFDSYEAHNTTPVGLLLNCDADYDGAVNVNDIVEIVDEIFAVGLAPGTPDCDRSGGAINVNDVVATVDKIFMP